MQGSVEGGGRVCRFKVMAGRGGLNMLVYLNDVYGETEIEIKENIMLVSPYANFDCRSLINLMKRQFVRNGCMYGKIFLLSKPELIRGKYLLVESPSLDIKIINII